MGFLEDGANRSSISAIIDEMGLDSRWHGSEAEFEPISEARSKRKREPGENIYGSSGALVDLISRQQPAMLIFDADNPAIPWKRWLPMLKRSPATRRIPILILSRLWQPENEQTAIKLGATLVLAKAQVAERLGSVISTHARIPDYAAIAAACNEAMDPRALQGIQAYNAGEYYDAHEFLEHAWIDDKGAGRDLYRSILQIAVALYQVQRGNYNGAVKMLLRVQQWLQPLPDTCRGVDVAALKDDANHYYDSVLQLGPDNLGSFDWALIRPVHISPTPLSS